MDICGAMSLKTNFKNVTTIYIQREKKALLANILKKNSSIEDKTNRILAIDFENKNASICDYIVSFDVPQPHRGVRMNPGEVQGFEYDLMHRPLQQ